MSLLATEQSFADESVCQDLTLQKKGKEKPPQNPTE